MNSLRHTPNDEIILEKERSETSTRQKLRATSQKRRSVVSMFSGCGGMDLGFRGGFEYLGRRYAKNPFEILWANDLNEAACRTYSENLKHDIHCGDIWELLGTLPAAEEVDVVIGGFPCQDISVNGKGRGIRGARSGLYRAMVEVVDMLQPTAFVAENVKGLLMRHNSESLATVLNDFSSLGYNVSYQLYHAANYGVPQSRERVFIVGTKPGVGAFKAPKFTHSRNEWINAREAIDDLKKLPEDVSLNHIWSKARRSPQQGDRRLIADRVGYTVRAECHGNIQWHYEVDRRISMREAARLQSFPDNFVFHAKLRETERQIGNAVPPVLAWHLARTLIKIL